MKPKKKLIAIRASDLTIRQLDGLALGLGMNQTELLTLAIDRLYQAEMSGGKLLARAHERIVGDPELNHYADALLDSSDIDDSEFANRLHWILTANKQELIAWSEEAYREIEEQPSL